MRGLIWTIILIWTAAAIVWAASTKAPANLRPWIDAIPAASGLQLFEGLPSPTSEPITRAIELQKPTFKLASEVFYSTSTAVEDEDQKALLVLLKNPSTFETYGGPKLCGGFHADYDIRWTSEAGDNVVNFLICLNCHEVLIGDGKRGSIYDIGNDGYKGLRSILTKYRKQRPKFRAEDDGAPKRLPDLRSASETQKMETPNVVAPPKIAMPPFPASP